MDGEKMAMDGFKEVGMWLKVEIEAQNVTQLVFEHETETENSQ